MKQDDLKTLHTMILFDVLQGDSKKTSSCQGRRGEEGWIRQAQRMVKQWKYSAILQWWCIIIHLSKPTEYTTPRVNHGVNFRRGVVMMRQCSSIPGKIRAIWWAGRGIWETFLPSCQSCCKPKTVLKKPVKNT